MARAQDIAGILGTWSRGHRPLYQQLADALRAAIERRDLPPGARVPAERELARTLVVSRNTVASAYEELKDQGYLESRQGSGTRVIGGNVGGVDPAVASSVPRLASLWRRGSEPEVVNLTRSGFRGVGDLPPDTIRLDPSELARLIDDSVGYSREGLPELRIEIARWMTRNQLPTDADQVLVTTGAQQAINLLTTVYLRPGDGVILENPTYYGAIDSFRWADARLLPVAIGAAWPERRRGCSPHRAPGALPRLLHALLPQPDRSRGVGRGPAPAGRDRRSERAADDRRPRARVALTSTTRRRRRSPRTPMPRTSSRSRP